MTEKKLPLEEVSIEDLFNSSEKSVYEIPIYQRNYAWEDIEITTLIQDVYDSFRKDPASIYYIGTLVTFFRGEGRYEIIDGQQRLTTIILILGVLGIPVRNRLTYSARKRSDDTINAIPEFDVDERDEGIVEGFYCAKNAVDTIVPDSRELEGYKTYFQNNVHLIRYKVPKDIDLNQYFEIMNSRGEQLEMHEIVKANLMQKLDTDEERRLFNSIWEACSRMSAYIQQNIERIPGTEIIGRTMPAFLPGSFDDVMRIYSGTPETSANKPLSILDIITAEVPDDLDTDFPDSEQPDDSFQPIIDFPNFLLIVLKITKMSETDFDPAAFSLDDKELLNEFGRNPVDVKMFAFNLLKARFFLDNYVVHHAKGEDSFESNPWKLQVWNWDPETKRGQMTNLCDNNDVQMELVHLLSMFEVSFTARQRKNYLFYCLLYLMQKDSPDVCQYRTFVRCLADSYFRKVYLDRGKLSAGNTPLPGSFDEVLLDGNHFSANLLNNNPQIPESEESVFDEIYGDGTAASRGIPLFIFNYLDYKIWKYYAETVRGMNLARGDIDRNHFFSTLGCSDHDFDLQILDKFYFSRTRRSLEHYYPQANATGKDGAPDENQINCFGNYAMIGSEANSSGSNWSPKTKLDHYLDTSGKISRISVASLKFMIMMQMCRDQVENRHDDVGWGFEQIREHQKRMLSIMMRP